MIASFVPTADQISWVIEHKALLGGFVTMIGDVVQFLLGAAPAAKEAPAKKAIERISQIVEPVAKDGGSQLMVFASDAANVTVNQIVIDSRDANALQNAARRLASKGLPAETYEKAVLLTLAQVKNDPTAKTGDRGIIEKIGTRAVRLRFMSPAVKSAVLDLQGQNPLHCAFVVDVRVLAIGGEPRVYEILAVDDVIPE